MPITKFAEKYTGKSTYMYYSWKVIKHEKASQWQMHWHNGDWLFCVIAINAQPAAQKM